MTTAAMQVAVVPAPGAPLEIRRMPVSARSRPAVHYGGA
jgi:hypothetical protein